MDQLTLSSDSVLETLLKTNRPPTDQEKAVVQRSMAQTNRELKDVRVHISETAAHLQKLKSQVQQVESKLQRLLESEAAILVTSEDQARVLSAIRILPEDVLREICIACVEAKMPSLSYRTIPLPYALSQISRGMRHIALTTPLIWASMDVDIRQHHYGGRLNEPAYKALSRRATEWFARSGGIPLTVFIKDPSRGIYRRDTLEPHPSDMLLDTLFRYSALWKNFHFDSGCEDLSIPILRVFALTAADVPVLQSITLRLEPLIPSSVTSKIAFLQISTLRHVSLETQHVRQLPLNWSVLTSVSLNGVLYDHCYSKHEIAQILQQTKCLVSFHIVVAWPLPEEEIYLDKINLPFLQILHIDEKKIAPAETSAPSLLDLISAPNLVEFHVEEDFLEVSVLNFVTQSPNISKLHLPYFETVESLTFLMTLLRHCPLLTVLHLWPSHRDWIARPADNDANLFLRFFVEEGNVGVACPRLQRFKITGRILFSMETFRLFLEKKQRYTTALNIQPWKRVFIYINCTNPTETHWQLSDLASQKKKEGLDVIFCFEGMHTKQRR